MVVMMLFALVVMMMRMSAYERAADHELRIYVFELRRHALFKRQRTHHGIFAALLQAALSLHRRLIGFGVGTRRKHSVDVEAVAGNLLQQEGLRRNTHRYSGACADVGAAVSGAAAEEEGQQGR